MLLEIVALTNVGLVRRHNEDSLLIDGALVRQESFGPTRYSSLNSTCVIMIADGMGGHVRGSLASSLVLSNLATARDELFIKQECELLIAAANDALYDSMDSEPQNRGMGTTLVGMALSAAEISFFNVGDSRAYQWADMQLVRLSHDDVPRSRETTGPRISHQITQSLGGHMRRTGVRPHFGRGQALNTHDAVLLCSDGLTDMVDESEIAEIFSDGLAIDLAAATLLSRAIEGGGTDNISLIIAKRAA